MKNLILITFSLIPLTFWGQQDYNIHYYLNGIEIIWEDTFINPFSIKSLNIEKIPPDANILIVTKDKEWRYKSLTEVLISLYNYDRIKAPDITPVFIIKGKVINNPDSIKIDNTYFAHAEIKPLSNVKLISDQCKTIVLIDIDLSDNPKKWDKVRGELPELDSIKK